MLKTEVSLFFAKIRKQTDVSEKSEKYEYSCKGELPGIWEYYIQVKGLQLPQ